MEEIKECGIIKKINSNERYFTGTGCKAFFSLVNTIENIYKDSDFERIMFIDDFDMSSNFLIKKIENIPDKFYIINIQKIQNNISSNNRATFEKSYCDIGFIKTDRLKLALELGEVLNTINKFYKRFQIDISAKIIKDENMAEKWLCDTIENMLKSENIAYELKDTMGDETVEVEFSFKKNNRAFIKNAYINISSEKIMFSITGGFENILSEILNSSEKKEKFNF